MKIVPPLSYLHFIRAQESAAVVVTDSGGVQEETSVLGVPCVTVRENTERPITLELGTNVLCPGYLQYSVGSCLRYPSDRTVPPRSPSGMAPQRGIGSRRPSRSYRRIIDDTPGQMRSYCSCSRSFTCSRLRSRAVPTRNPMYRQPIAGLRDLLFPYRGTKWAICSWI